MKKIISIFVLTTFILSSCGKEEVIVSDVTPVKYVKTETLVKKSFSEDLKLTGKITSSKETTISPQTTGIIKSINYKIGDNVKAGDILASIDTQSNLSNINLNNASNSYNNTLSIYNFTKESISKDLDNAKLQYNNAITSKENTYKTTDKQLELAENQLDSVKKQKGNATKTVDASLDLANNSLSSAKLTLDNFNKTSKDTLKSQYTKQTNLYKNIKATITSSLSSINSGLNFADTTLGVTAENKNLNDAYEIYLSAKNISSKINAEEAFRKANSEYVNIISTWNENLSGEEVETYFLKLQNLIDENVALFNYMTDTLNNSITSTSFPDSSLTGLKTTNQINKSTALGLKSSIVALSSQLDDLKNAITSTENSILTTRASLEQAVLISESSLNNTISNTNSNLDNVSSAEISTKTQLESAIANIKASRDMADNSVKMAENQYISMKAKFDSQLVSTKSQLDSINGQMDLASQQLSNSIIRAPFDGVVTVKNIEVGSLVSPGVQAFSVANNEDKIVKLDLSSDNIKYLSIGKPVDLEKDNIMYSGIVSTVGVSADPMTKMYKVEIKFDSKMDISKLVLGSFIDVFIKKENTKETYIIVPFSSLITNSSSEYYVYVVGSGSLVESKKVNIGPSNSHEIVITDGLIEGERVVTNGSLSVDVGDSVEEIK